MLYISVTWFIKVISWKFDVFAVKSLAERLTGFLSYLTMLSNQIHMIKQVIFVLECYQCWNIPERSFIWELQNVCDLAIYYIVKNMKPPKHILTLILKKIVMIWINSAHHICRKEAIWQVAEMKQGRNCQTIADGNNAIKLNCSGTFK